MSQKVGKIDDKNEDFSKSVNSFHSGPIFHPSLGHKLSSDVFVVSILLSERISGVDKVFFHDSEKSRFS